MISISHWGMFPHVPAILYWPPGFKLTRGQINEMLNSGSVVVISPSDIVD